MRCAMLLLMACCLPGTLRRTYQSRPQAAQQHTACARHAHALRRHSSLDIVNARTFQQHESWRCCKHRAARHAARLAGKRAAVLSVLQLRHCYAAATLLHKSSQRRESWAVGDAIAGRRGRAGRGTCA